MSININKYGNNAAYLADQDRPNENCVSQVGQTVVYNGKNVILRDNQLKEDNVCCVFADNVTDEKVFIPVETLNMSTLDTDRYTLKNYILFGMCKGQKLYISGAYSSSVMWAQNNFYKIVPDLTANGAFDWAITINGTAKSGSVSWSAGDTLASIVTQLQAGAVASRLIFAADASGEYVRVTVNNYSNSTLTLSNTSNVTLVDLSETCTIAGVAQTTAHHQWQGVAAKTMFANYPGVAPSTVLYAKNGYNKSYRCGGNYDKFVQYFRANGSATYVTENGNGIMSEAGFAALDGGTDAAQTLFDKYNGDWYAYMEAQMLQLDDLHKTGMEYLSYDNGKACNDFLASVMTVDFDGNEIPAFPAAYAAAQSSVDGVAMCLPTIHELGMFSDVDRMERINIGIAVIGGTKLTNAQYPWSSAEYSASYAWLYHGGTGTVPANLKYSTYGVRPVLASEA